MTFRTDLRSKQISTHAKKEGREIEEKISRTEKACEETEARAERVTLCGGYSRETSEKLAPTDMSAEEEKVKLKHEARAERAAAEATRGQQESADMIAEEASQAAVAAWGVQPRPSDRQVDISTSKRERG